MKANLKLYFLFASLLAATVARAQGPMGYDIANDQPRWGESTTVLSYTHHPEAADYDFPAPGLPQVGSESPGGGSGEPGAGETTIQATDEFLQSIWTSA